MKTLTTVIGATVGGALGAATGVAFAEDIKKAPKVVVKKAKHIGKDVKNKFSKSSDNHHHDENAEAEAPVENAGAEEVTPKKVDAEVVKEGKKHHHKK